MTDLAKGSILALCYRVAGLLFWAATGIGTARALSVSDRGAFASAVVIVAGMSNIASMFAGSSGFFVANRRRDPGEVAVNSALLSAALGCGLLVPALIAAVVWPGADRALIILVGLAILPNVIREAMEGVFLGTGAIARYSFCAHAPAILGLGVILLWVVLLDHRTAASALGAWTASQYLALLASALLGWRWWRWLPAHGVDRRLIRDLVTFGGLTGFVGLFGVLNARLGQLLVVGLEGREAAGIYSSAASVADGLGLFAAAAAIASYARVGAGTPAASATLTARAVRHTLLLSYSAAAMLWLVAPVLIPLLFGQRYEDAVVPLRVLCIGAPAFPSLLLVTNYFIVQLGRPLLSLALAASTSVVGVSLGIAVVPRGGYVGAACTMTVTYLLAAALACFIFVRVSGAVPSDLWRIRRSDLADYPAFGRRILRGLASRP